MRETALRSRHEALGARLIPFAGWLMPVQYSGVIDEHRTVRSAAGLFDLGHMGQVRVTGPDALAYLQHVTTNDVSALEPGDAQYSLLPNAEGGVIDDIIVYRLADEPGYLVVVNAANHDKDVAWMQQQRLTQPDLEVDVDDVSESLGMIAIQGPMAPEIVAGLTETDLSGLEPFHCLRATVAGLPVLVARTGYTGEDGFEFYVPQEQTAELWDALVDRRYAARFEADRAGGARHVAPRSTHAAVWERARGRYQPDRGGSRLGRQARQGTVHRS